MPKENLITDACSDLRHIKYFFENRLGLPADTCERNLRDALSELQSCQNSEVILLGGNFRFMISDLLIWLDGLRPGETREKDEFFSLKDYIREVLEMILIYCEDEYPSGYPH